MTSCDQTFHYVVFMYNFKVVDLYFVPW